MNTNLRIDVLNISPSFITDLQDLVKDLNEVRLHVADEDEYRLSGREVFTFVMISMASGVIGDTASGGIGIAIEKLTSFFGEEAEKQKEPISLIVNGVRCEISGSSDALQVKKDILDELAERKN
ncbi:hypothetical protein [Rhizobium leguminosarum]|uniref:hypothetical protein n=1 Tax=Rhizobium leguminosarum TaxID=384 RepID=UPI0010300DB6|nr:hypothetical protein [Rhizobium leguminosarum]TAX36481.1 hypothetical protein ELI06_20180 [Rhizobium leguminosarum]